MPRRVTGTDVWVAADDGSDLVRAAAIISLATDCHGTITARTGPGDAMIVTLAGPGRQHGARPPGDFHRQLIQIIAQLSDASGSFLIRPAHDQAHGWQWTTEPL